MLGVLVEVGLLVWVPLGVAVDVGVPLGVMVGVGVTEGVDVEVGVAVNALQFPPAATAKLLTPTVTLPELPQLLTAMPTRKVPLRLTVSEAT